MSCSKRAAEELSEKRRLVRAKARAIILCTESKGGTLRGDSEGTKKGIKIKLKDTYSLNASRSFYRNYTDTKTWKSRLRI